MADNFCHTTPAKTDCVGSLAPCRDSRVISFTSSYSLLSLITLLSLGPYRVFSFSFLHPLSFSKKTNFRIGWMGMATPTFWFSVPLLPPPPPPCFLLFHFCSFPCTKIQHRQLETLQISFLRTSLSAQRSNHVHTYSFQPAWLRHTSSKCQTQYHALGKGDTSRVRNVGCADACCLTSCNMSRCTPQIQCNGGGMCHRCINTCRCCCSCKTPRPFARAICRRPTQIFVLHHLSPSPARALCPSDASHTSHDAAVKNPKSVRSSTYGASYQALHLDARDHCSTQLRLAEPAGVGCRRCRATRPESTGVVARGELPPSRVESVGFWAVGGWLRQGRGRGRRSRDACLPGQANLHDEGHPLGPLNTKP